MKILYICSPPLLDYSIEQISSLQNCVDLHVVITVSLHSPNHSIFKLKDNFNKTGLFYFHEVKQFIEYSYLFEQYIERCKSVSILFFSKNFGLNILFTNLRLLRHLKIIKPDVIHFDDVSYRMMFFFLLIKKQKIVLNIHDPKPHFGEILKYTLILRKILYKRVSVFCTFSKFSKDLFHQEYNYNSPCIDLRLVPYNFYKLYPKQNLEYLASFNNKIKLLFFGRISPYKGIDELLVTFSKITQNYTNVVLIIAGSGKYQYKIPEELIDSPNLFILNRFINNFEINYIFNSSDLIICPYIEATQSGVLMTAAPFNTPALVSNVGALKEYLFEKDFIYNNGELEKAIIYFIENYRISEEKSIKIGNLDLESNTSKLLKLYNSLK